MRLSKDNLAISFNLWNQHVIVKKSVPEGMIMDYAAGYRIGDEERRLMHLVPAPAVRLMKRRVLSTPGLNSLMS